MTLHQSQMSLTLGFVRSSSGASVGSHFPDNCKSRFLILTTIECVSGVNVGVRSACGVSDGVEWQQTVLISYEARLHYREKTATELVTIVKAIFKSAAMDVGR
ncbi:hypothetical protein BaRGS_00017338 [Batillaria attramentaria]|uniref:Uncharacterized protein n=1 Tax=Batillaria attramentaria TaxID=370345 RepID=A0ABD0KWK6_9CAEN